MLQAIATTRPLSERRNEAPSFLARQIALTGRVIAGQLARTRRKVGASQNSDSAGRVRQEARTGRLEGTLSLRGAKWTQGVLEGQRQGNPLKFTL